MEDKNKRIYPDPDSHLEMAISEIYEPCAFIQQSDEQITTAELVRRIKLDLQFEFEASKLISIMRNRGFKKVAIEGAAYWLVKFTSANQDAF